MHSFSTLTTVLLLSILTLCTAAPDRPAPGPHLTLRQTTQDPQSQAPLTDPLCLTYSITANLSTVGSNSSYRSAFYARSTTGSMYDNRMFASAKQALPKMTSDAGLNARCGNLTTVALVEAERNLTMGMVLQFGGVVPQGIRAGPEVMVIVGGIVVLFFGVWSFMP